MRAHGTKRLLPYFTGMQMSRSASTTVRDWRATMLEAVEAGEWAPKTVNNARVALLGCCRMAVEDGLMAHNPVLDVRPLPIDFTERPYLRLAQINDYIDACAPHYRPLAALLSGPARASRRRSRCGDRRRRPRRRHGEDPQAAGPRRIARDPPDQGPQLPHRGDRPGAGRPCCATCSPCAPSTALDDGGWLFLCPSRCASRR